MGTKTKRAKPKLKSKAKSKPGKMAVAKARAKSGAKTMMNSILSKIKKAKIKDSVLVDMPSYAQTEDFTSSAACAMMVLKYVNPGFKFKREHEYSIWQEAVNGSVWYGSKYGLAYALAKRGAKVV